MADDERWRIIVGLGNPGSQYAGTRHNVGFMVVDALAHAHGLKFSKMLNRGMAAFGEGALRRVVLLKPQTFMNESGACVAPTAKFYKCASADVMVIYDELDLPFGSLRMKPTGSAAGHNGMRSLIARLGTQDFPRLRFGIGRPPGKMEGAGFVLQSFSKIEQAELSGGHIDRAVKGLMTWLDTGVDKAMNVVNTTV